MPLPAENAFGAQAPPFDYTHQHAMMTKTYHGFSVVNERDQIIGRVTSWNPMVFSRDGTFQYELSHVTAGLIIDYVPGKNGEQTIAIARVELWDNEFEIALGYPTVWETLIDQSAPFSIYEYLYRGSELYHLFEFAGCWFREKQIEAWSTDGDYVIKLTGTIAWVKRTQQV